MIPFYKRTKHFNLKASGAVLREKVIDTVIRIMTAANTTIVDSANVK